MIGGAGVIGITGAGEIKIPGPDGLEIMVDLQVNAIVAATKITKAIYGKYSHGITYTNNTISIVSYGVGTAIIPMRIGTVPEIIILKIK